MGQPANDMPSTSLVPEVDSGPWELALLADQLSRALREVEYLRNDFRSNSRNPTGVRVVDTVSAISRAVGALEDFQQLIDTLEVQFSPSSQIAVFGALGRRGDDTAIARISSGIIECYISFLDWAAALRGTVVPVNARAAYREISVLAEIPLLAIESFVSDLQTTIEMLEQEHAERPSDDLRQTLVISVTMDDAIMAPAKAAIQLALDRMTMVPDSDEALASLPLSNLVPSDIAVLAIRSFEDAEKAARHHMASLGYSDAMTTAAGRDGGIDVVAEGVVAQVKAQVRPVGAPQVQQLFGVAASNGVRALFYALSGYTPAALAFAEANEVYLFEFDLAGGARPSNSWADGLQQLLVDPSADDFLPAATVQERWVTDLVGANIRTVSHSASHILVESVDRERGGHTEYALDEATGNLTWSQALPSGKEFQSRTAIVGERVVVAVVRSLNVRAGVTSESSELMAFDAASGSECWRASIDGGVRMGRMVSHDTLLPLLVSPFLEKSQYWLLDVTSGKIIWKTELAGGDIEEYTIASITSDLVVLTIATVAGEFVVALDLFSGREIWRRQIYSFRVSSEESWHEAVVTPDRIYAFSSPIHGSRVQCIALDGSLLWASQEMIAAPLELSVAAGVVAVMSIDAVIGFSGSDGSVIWRHAGDVRWVRTFDARFLICEFRRDQFDLTWLNPISGEAEAGARTKADSSLFPSKSPWIRSDGFDHAITSGFGNLVTQHSISLGK